MHLSKFSKKPMHFRALAEEAKHYGLAVIIWSYPRRSGLSKAGETAIDVTAYAAHTAAQLGAHHQSKTSF